MKVRHEARLYLAAMALGCGGEVNSGGTGGVGGTDGTGGTGTGGSAGMERTCTGALPNPDPEHVLANWPMPNPPASGLANPASYDTSRPDVVIDNVTGLMWQRGASPIAEEHSFESAAAYCGELDVGGHCDWRLPTRIELASLVDFTRREPAIDTEVFSDFPAPNPQELRGWSFFTASWGEDHEWRVDFWNGASFRVQRSIALAGARARCVRVHVEHRAPEPRYVIEGQAPEDVVTDRGTSLVWQRSASQLTYSFSDAQAYCDGLELQGRGWRVPSMKEIQTLVDERVSPPFDQEVFLNIPRGAIRTSSQNPVCELCAAWLMDGEGRIFDTRVDSGLDVEHSVRCVQ